MPTNKTNPDKTNHHHQNNKKQQKKPKQKPPPNTTKFSKKIEKENMYNAVDSLFV